ncbi:hypothetical protein A2U01_0004226 [Trifolium medium]|uniref:Uncharacterized protein n=1 Tax=Trifolium medium TaxID=97028 RepID=A0A392M7L0_9FABA|nr:hypothetical protein [Trifolium medium]
MLTCLNSIFNDSVRIETEMLFWSLLLGIEKRVYMVRVSRVVIEIFIGIHGVCRDKVDSRGFIMIHGVSRYSVVIGNLIGIHGVGIERFIDTHDAVKET